MDVVEIQKLLTAYKHSKKKSIKNRLLSELKPLVTIIAKKFLYLGENFKDLQQVGMIGLLKVMDNYKITHRAKMFSYISKKVMGEIKHYFRDSYKLIKIPRRYFKTYYEMNKFIQAYIQKNKGKSPTVQQIARALGESEEMLLETMEIIHSCSLLNADKSLLKSLVGDQPVLENKKDNLPTDSIPDFEDKIDNLLLLNKIMDNLSFRERKILQLYYGDNMTQKEIARRFNISQVYVFRIINKAMDRCRLIAERERRFN